MLSAVAVLRAARPRTTTRPCAARRRPSPGSTPKQTSCCRAAGTRSRSASRYGTRVAFVGTDSEDSDDHATRWLAEAPVPYPSYIDRGELVWLKQGAYPDEEELEAEDRGVRARRLVDLRQRVTVKVRTAGVGSTFPTPSMARTSNVWEANDNSK